MSGARTALSCLLVTSSLMGCGKLAQQPSEPNTASAGAASGGTGNSVPTDGVDMAGALPVLPEQQCATEGPRPGPHPLSRLGHDELNNSVRLLLPEDAAAPPWLPESRFANDPESPVSVLDLERLHVLAHAVALELTNKATNGAWLASCDPASEGEAACRDALGEPLLERIYRRPLTDEDREELADVFAKGRKLGGTFESGLRAVAEVALQGPDFVYLLEQGTGRVVQGAMELTGHETAARVAFLLTGSPPDAELLEEAERGPLDPGAIEAQARRLLAEAKHQTTLSRTLRSLILPREPTAKPELGFTDELAFATDEASLRFIEDVAFRGKGTLTALLTEPSTWANETLSAYYGYTAGRSGWRRVELDPTRAAGLFTQPAFLAATSHGEPSAVMRGVHVLRDVLCVSLPPPPPSFTPVLPPVTEGTTGRQRLESSTADASCKSCHLEINAVGFAFEHYDATGKWRDTDSGLAIDSSGTLGLTDAQGPFADAVELMHRVAGSQAARECFVRHWLERGYRRDLSDDDACAQRELNERFSAENGRIDELLVALAQSDNLRYRPKSELER